METATGDARLGELSEIIIDTLKALSLDAAVITPRILQKALVAKPQFIRLMDPAARSEEPAATSPAVSGTGPRIDLPNAEGSGPAGALPSSERENLKTLRGLLLEVLAEVEENSSSEDLPILNEIRGKTRDSLRMDQLLEQGDRLVRIVRSHFSRLSGELSQVTRLLAHMGEGLHEMENLMTNLPTGMEASGSNGAAGSPLNGEAGDGASTFAGRNLNDLKSMIEGKLPLIKTMLENKKQRGRPREGDSREMNGVRRRLTEMGGQLDHARRKTRVLEIELFRDPLTGVYNRRACKQRVAAEFRNFHRGRQDFCVLILKVDDFQHINERFGYVSGDQCLKELAGVIRDSLRGSDFLARCGGDLFAAVLPRTSEDIIPIITRRLRKNIAAARFHHKKEAFGVTVSIGAVHAIHSDRNAEEVFKRAEKALLEEESAGRPTRSALPGRRESA